MQKKKTYIETTLGAGVRGCSQKINKNRRKTTASESFFGKAAGL